MTALPKTVSAEAGPTEPLPSITPRKVNRVAGFFIFLAAYSFTCLSTIVCATTVFVMLPFTKNGESFFKVAKAWATGIMRVSGVRLEVHSEAPLPDGPVVFAGNHQSQIDILLFFMGLPRWFVFVAKKSIFSYPFLGWAIAAMQYIPVDRGNRAQAIKSLEAAALRVHEGLSVMVFPEGTRSGDGSVLPFKKGPFMLALHAGVPIVPVAIEGSLFVNPKRRWYFSPNTVRILIGAPIPTAGLKEGERDALIGAVRASVIRMHRRLGGLGGDERSHVAAAGLEGIGRAAEAER